MRARKIYLYTRLNASQENLLLYKTKCEPAGKFTYIQDQMRARKIYLYTRPFCCSLRDKFGVIFSLLPFLLIYKTK